MVLELVVVRLYCLLSLQEKKKEDGEKEEDEVGEKKEEGLEGE